MTVLEHSTLTKQRQVRDVQFRTAARRFIALKQQHQAASQAMWRGMLGAAFTADELRLLSDYISPADTALLRAWKADLTEAG